MTARMVFSLDIQTSFLLSMRSSFSVPLNLNAFWKSLLHELPTPTTNLGCPTSIQERIFGKRFFLHQSRYTSRVERPVVCLYLSTHNRGSTFVKATGKRFNLKKSESR